MILQILICKNMLNSYHFLRYYLTLASRIEHKVSLEAFRAIEALVKHDNNMKDYSAVD